MNESRHLTTMNIALYLWKSEVIDTDFRPKKEQRESAYVGRKRMWRTLPEPSSAALVALANMESTILEMMGIQ